MQITLPNLIRSTIFVLDEEERFDDDRYFDFCVVDNPDLNIERTSEGAIVIVPHVGGETAYRITIVTCEVHGWAKKDGRGRSSGPTAQFILPDGSALSARSAWTSNARLAGISKQELRKFPRLVPEFVVEVMSQDDRLSDVQTKMRLWAANGVELGWLIDGDNRCVYVYRGKTEPRVVVNADSISGEGPIEGFVLPLEEIWAGL